MYTVRKATTNDVIAIRDVATKAWYNTCLLYTSPSPRDS